MSTPTTHDTASARSLARTAGEQHDYEGFHTRPMSWGTVAGKFDRLAAPHLQSGLRAQICEAVGNLDSLQVDELTGLLATPVTTA